ncbi:MAG: glycosyltransferase 87 family protein [Actinomycetota bacterium]|nr:glycosyltransferase 87 family protein [Actinomycetota bacterium]
MTSTATWLLAVLIVAAGVAPIARHYLVTWPQDQWQVDLEVYREAGRSIIYGRHIYDVLTEPPQLLPFTYPPFAALIALPIALVPFEAAAWLWTAAQVAATAATVWIAGRPLLARAGRWRPVATGAVTVVMVWLHPVSDGIRFGQVNAFIVLACLVDLAVRRPRWARGVLIGLATAVKLTPGTFLLYFLSARRWRAAVAVLAGAAGATVAALLILPEASLAFWGGALQDPNRLGPNGGTSNQSIRGFLIRLGPSGVAGSVLWVVLLVLTLWLGFAVARRANDSGELALQVGAVGLVAVLISPVSWIHHLAWLVVVIPALVGDGRDLRRWAYAGVLTAWFLCRLPWWGVRWRTYHHSTAWFGKMMQNADTVGAALALLFIWLVVRRVGGAAPVVGGLGGLDAEVDSGRLQGGDDREDETDAAADPADRRQAHPA